MWVRTKGIGDRLVNLDRCESVQREADRIVAYLEADDDVTLYVGEKPVEAMDLIVRMLVLHAPNGVVDLRTLD